MKKRIWVWSILLLLLGITIFFVEIRGNSKSDKTEAGSGTASVLVPENASDSKSIDNVSNVENYRYESKSSKDQKILLLKDLEFSFYEDLLIPGMPNTKKADYENNYIFSESQCPQGMCFTEEYIMLTSYSEGDTILGELMVFDRRDGSYLVTLGMDPESHLGGISFDGENVWVCNSNKDYIERLSYDFIQLMVESNRGNVVDASEIVDIYPVQNSPSCITYYEGRLFVATHKVHSKSEVVAYYFDKLSDSLCPLSSYSIPEKVQGMAFDNEGAVYLSTSYGRNASSYLKKYESFADMATQPEQPSVSVELPPCSEEIEVIEDIIYLLFESGGEKYFYGTDGNGSSQYPIDKILMIERGGLH